MASLDGVHCHGWAHAAVEEKATVEGERSQASDNDAFTAAINSMLFPAERNNSELEGKGTWVCQAQNTAKPACGYRKVQAPRGKESAVRRKTPSSAQYVYAQSGPLFGHLGFWFQR